MQKDKHTALLLTLAIISTDALVSIDATKAFGKTGGLPVAGAEEIVQPIMEVAPLFGEEFTFEVNDNHPPEHIGFYTVYVDVPMNITELTTETVGTIKLSDTAPFDHAYLEWYLEHNRHGGQNAWNVHGVIGTHEVERLAGLENLKASVTLFKGTDPKCDSHSGALDALGRSTGLIEHLRAKNIKRIFLVGLAFDYCVGMTAIDLANAGFEVFIVMDATRSVGIKVDGFDSIKNMRRQLRRAGVRLIWSKDLIAANS